MLSIMGIVGAILNLVAVVTVYFYMLVWAVLRLTDNAVQAYDTMQMHVFLCQKDILIIFVLGYIYLHSLEKTICHFTYGYIDKILNCIMFVTIKSLIHAVILTHMGCIVL